jgi:ubiquinone/menaquinone biosynthesis C-methylase UbiE
MLSEINRVLSPTGVYVCISHGTEAQRKKYMKNLKKYNWIRTKTMIQKPGLGSNVKELKTPKEDDKKNFNFIYTCRK